MGLLLYFSANSPLMCSLEVSPDFYGSYSVQWDISSMCADSSLLLDQSSLFLRSFPFSEIAFSQSLSVFFKA